MLHGLRNLGPVQRVLRVVGGIGMGAGGLMMWQGMPMGYALAGMGLMGVLTGLMGYCPACALMGVGASAGCERVPR